MKLLVWDKCLGLIENLAEFYGEARWQRCVVHFYRNVWTAVPSGKVREVAAMLKAIHAQEDREAARQKADAVVVKLQQMKLAQAAQLVRDGIEETLSYYEFPREHWRCLRTNNPLERIMREIRRRTRVVGAFPDGQSALMLVAARLRHIAGTKWGSRRYLDMQRLKEAAAVAACNFLPSSEEEGKQRTRSGTQTKVRKIRDTTLTELDAFGGVLVQPEMIQGRSEGYLQTTLPSKSQNSLRV